MDRGAWQATYSPRGHKDLDTTEQLSLTQNVLCLIEGYTTASEAVLVSLCVKHVYGISGGEIVPCFLCPGRAGFGFLLRE